MVCIQFSNYFYGIVYSLYRVNNSLIVCIIVRSSNQISYNKCSDITTRSTTCACLQMISSLPDWLFAASQFICERIGHTLVAVQTKMVSFLKLIHIVKICANLLDMFSVCGMLINWNFRENCICLQIRISFFNIFYLCNFRPISLLYPWP